MDRRRYGLIAVACIVVASALREFPVPPPHPLVELGVNEAAASFMTSCGERVQLRGAATAIERNQETREYRFVVVSGRSAVEATYTGAVPSTFQNGAEIMATGVLCHRFVVEPFGIAARSPR